MDGIRIPEEVAKAEGVPEDLDSGVLGPYRFPSPVRRRTAALVYVAGAVLSALGALAGLPSGLWAISAAFLVVAFLHDRAAWPLAIEQEDALTTAAAQVPFAIGHASAALGFTGMRSRPVWNVIVYSVEEPPVRRALVRLDATTGMRLDSPYVEEIEPPD
ncbi:MAG: hypothetical protein OXS29_02160 [bacterium]|nr:hypothetical protein [bacterium]MDE0290824.1 hypothetical protein [bacterium]MDE0438238.1 hypothetical protein [bacterium]